MGGILSYFIGSKEDDPSLDVPDNATGLTPRERQMVTDSWAIIYKDAKPFGVKLFIELFKTHPEHQQKFPSFKNVPIADLHGSKKLEAHATNVMSSIATLVDNLHDPGCLVELSVKIGENHSRRKVPQQSFFDVKALLMKLMKEKLGSKLTPQGEEAWSKTLDLANKFIFEGYGGKENN